MKINKYYLLVFGVILSISLFQFGCVSKVPVSNVKYDANLIIKKKIVLGNIVGGIKKIQKGDFSDSEIDEIAVIGQTSYFLLSSKDYRVLEYHEYLDSNEKPIFLGLSPQLLDLNHDYALEVMLGGGGFGRVGLLDSSGEEKWEFKDKSELSPHKMITTISGQNSLFYVAGYTGIDQLDSNGNVVWHFGAESYFDVSLLDSGVIVGLNDNSDLVFLSEDGSRLKTLNIDCKIYNFQIIKWPSEEKLLIEAEGIIRILDFQGNQLFQYKIDNFPSYHAPQGVSVRFEKNEQPFLALLLHSRSSVGVSQLNIFRVEGELIYQEILHSTTGIYINTNSSKEGETLLIGGDHDSIIEYQITKKQ